MKPRLLVTTLILALGSAGAMAQTDAASTVQRDVNQQTRIGQGLQNGSLSTQEAGRLEREQSQIERLQAKYLRDGKLTPRERGQLERAQDKASRDIQAAETNGVRGDPQSASSQRLQADVQRNIEQEKRIAQGIQTGSLTNREAARLERGQSRVDRREAAAARDGVVSPNEQAAIQRKENHQGRKIFKEKHDAQHRHG